MKGYFDDGRREYVITDLFPRREQFNYLWNENTVSITDQFGCGNTWCREGNARRQIDAGARNVYIKDRKTGLFYSANRNYTRLPFETHECRVGLGYQKIIGEYQGIRTMLTLLVPIEGNFVLFDIRIENKGEKRELDVYFCDATKPALGGHESYAEGKRDEAVKGILYTNDGYNLGMMYTALFLASSKAPIAVETAYNRFCGVYNSYADPIALHEDTLSSQGITFESGLLGAMQYRLTLKKGETWRTVLVCGTAKNAKECEEMANRFAAERYFDEEFGRVVRAQEGYLGVFEAMSPDPVLNSQANIWLKRQLSLGKTWGRVYGKGFRDVTQDVTAFVSFDIAVARSRLLEILKHQFEDGNPIRMFEPDMLYPYNDGGVWIPAAVLAYLNESGDLSLLQEKIPYLVGTSTEKMSFTARTGFRPYEGTEKTSTVFEHVKAAMDYLYGSRGERGLVLFRGGDWNDSLNAPGRAGKGESVWLTVATVKAYNEFLEILSIAGREELIPLYSSRRDELKERALRFGRDGDHLLYGYDDAGRKIGSDENEYAKIFLNPQTWAVLANLADKQTLEMFMDSVEKRLACPYGYVQCYPSYRKGDDGIGRISYFKPGLVENGSVYNHGVAFKIIADCLLGRGDAAYASLKKIRFDNPDNPENGMEPYAVSNMFIGPENPYLAGYAPMTWITGTAGWLYRGISEYIFGLMPTFRGLKIQPCFPSEWDRASAKRVFRGSLYEVEYRRGKRNRILLDGKETVGNVLPTDGEKRVHTVLVEYR